MTDAFTEHKPRCPKCRMYAIVDRENNFRCPRCGYDDMLADWR
jgi:tRNA(Ile2) C34 agmatinyltransferase TiaS